ncbi:MAG: alpha/beta hydrolase [Anaerolineales bacterium]|nr:MAG: alpha/beta hydrolase [Anaerolineales bacterium]
MNNTSSQGVVEVNNARLYYEIDGKGPTIVFLPGFTLDTRMWDDQFEYFAKRFQVVRYDLRGFGKSSVPTTDEYSHVEDLKALLDYLKIEHAYVVGLSKGGAVALDFTLTYPKMVDALVLIDSVLHGFDWSAEGEARDGLVWEEAAKGGIPAAKRSWLTHPLFTPAQRQPAVAARLAQIIDEYSGWHFVNHNHEHNLRPPAAKRLHEIAIPTLAIVGQLDLPDFLNITDLIAREAPHVKKITIPNVGHMANMEAPEEVNRAIDEFLKEVR